MEVGRRQPGRYKQSDAKHYDANLSQAMQATLSKLTYCVLGPTQPPTLSGTGNE